VVVEQTASVIEELLDATKRLSYLKTDRQIDRQRRKNYFFCLSSKICGPIEAFLYCGQFIFDVGYLDILTWGKKKRLRKETEKQRDRKTEMYNQRWRYRQIERQRDINVESKRNRDSTNTQTNKQTDRIIETKL